MKIVLQRCGYFVDFTVGTVSTLSFIVVMRLDWILTLMLFVCYCDILTIVRISNGYGWLCGHLTRQH